MSTNLDEHINNISKQYLCPDKRLICMIDPERYSVKPLGIDFFKLHNIPRDPQAFLKEYLKNADKSIKKGYIMS